LYKHAQDREDKRRDLMQRVEMEQQEKLEASKFRNGAQSPGCRSPGKSPSGWSRDTLYGVKKGEEKQRLRTEKLHLMQGGDDALSRTQEKVRELTGQVQQQVERNSQSRERLQQAERKRSEAKQGLSTIREEIEAEEGKAQDAQIQLEEKRNHIGSLQSQLEQQQEEAARWEKTCSGFDSDIAELEAKLQSEEATSVDLEALQKKHAELLAESREEEQRHREVLANREKELEEARAELERHGAEVLQKKDEEMRHQMDEIRKLEAERSGLREQVARLDVERQALQDRLLEKEHVRNGITVDLQRKEQECNELTATIQETQSATAQFEQRGADLEAQLTALAKQKESSHSELELLTRQVQAAQDQIDEANAQAEREAVEKAHKLQTLSAAVEADESKAQSLQQSTAALDAEAEEILAACKTMQAQEQEMREKFEGMRKKQADLQQARNQLEQKRIRQAEQAKRSVEAVATKRRVQDYEASLAQLSDRLVEAQEAVRRRHTEEEDLRGEIQKLKESIRSTNDKMQYQVSHSELQFETIQNLSEQKTNFEGEVEVLTLGFNDSRERNLLLQTENAAMQQQMEGLYNGSMQDWAAQNHGVQVVNAVEHYKEEIDKWKQKAEHMRKEKQQEIAALQRQHEEVVKKLRDRVASVQTEIERCEHTAKRREAALAKQREHGETAPTDAMQGLVVPQRPLPQNAGRRKALMVGINYTSSHAPLKGCVNDLWNLQCLLRHTLQYGDDQLRLLIDSVDGRPQKPDRMPTKANILAGLQWLTADAQPGDRLLFIFCGYGAQHPRTPGSDQYEGYIVPVDFAADLPANFFEQQQQHHRSSGEH